MDQPYDTEFRLDRNDKEHLHHNCRPLIAALIFSAGTLRGVTAVPRKYADNTRKNLALGLTISAILPGGTIDGSLVRAYTEALTMDIPVTRFDGFLRSIRLADLDSLSRDALDFVCRQFFGRDVANEEGVAANAAASRDLGLSKHFQDGGMETPFAYRRFAGDAAVPRGRYYSVANDAFGDDGGTLEAELGAYSDLSKAGPVWIHDTVGMELGLVMYFWQFRRKEFDDPAAFLEAVRGSIIFHFDFSNIPVSFDFADSYTIYTQAHRLKHHEFAVFVPTSVKRHSIERCVDLRVPDVREAVITFLDQGIPGVFSVDRTGVYKSLNVRSASSAPSPTAIGDDPAALVYGPSPHWEGSESTLPSGLSRLLAYLTYGQRGGSPLTDAVARHFRRAKVDALIFPSARCDIRVEIDNGSLHRWNGWNLVDYRDAPPPHSKAALIVEPQSWMNAMAGSKLRMAPDAGPLAGSFSLEGPTEALHSYLEAEASENRGV